MSAPSQAAPGGPFDMIRPEQITKLPMLSDVEKQKFKAGLEKLWTTAEENPEGSDLHNRAIAKIREVSRELMRRLATSRNAGPQAMRPQPQSQPQSQSAQQQTQQQQTQQQSAQQSATTPAQPQQNAQPATQKVVQQTGVQQTQQNQQTPQVPQQSSQPEQPARPSSQQQQQQQQQTQPQQQQQQQAQTQAQPQQNQQAQQVQQNQAAASQQSLSQGAKNFMQSFKVYPTPTMSANSKEFADYRNKIMSTLHQCLLSSEKYTAQVKQIDAREATGQGVSAELISHRNNARQILAKARSEFDNIKKSNEQNRQYWANVGNGGQGQNGNMNMNAQGTPSQVGQQPMIAQNQQQMQPNTQASQMAGNMQQDGSQIRAGQNQMSPANAMPFQNQNQNQGAAMHSTASQQGQMQMPQQQQQQQQQQAQNMTARPQPMPQQQQLANQQAQASQMGQQPGAPQALSHQAAVNAAARTYSEVQQRGTPSQPATPHGNFTPAMNASTTTTTANARMAIPQKLNINPHSPVALPPARPTFGGPGNGPSGMMGQPAVQKPPGFILEGEGDRVLSKKKLDELVRQVTGGGDGDGLTADVEEVMFSRLACASHTDYSRLFSHWLTTLSTMSSLPRVDLQKFVQTLRSTFAISRLFWRETTTFAYRVTAWTRSARSGSSSQLQDGHRR